jgi:triosephosphate isomerase
MLQDLVHYVIIGHSERRIYFHESLEDVREKVAACIRNKITPILCVGETKQERQHGESRRVVHDQLSTALSNLTAREVENVVVVYEPVWGISTFDGEPPKPSDVKIEIDNIRSEVKELYGSKASERIRVLSGGSVNEKAAAGYLEIEGCDGVLVGSASLNYLKFASIVETAYKLSIE